MADSRRIAKRVNPIDTRLDRESWRSGVRAERPSGRTTLRPDRAARVLRYVEGRESAEELEIPWEIGGYTIENKVIPEGLEHTRPDRKHSKYPSRTGYGLNNGL
jgi:hypothetical protein